MTYKYIDRKWILGAVKIRNLVVDEKI